MEIPSQLNLKVTERRAVFAMLGGKTQFAEHFCDNQEKNILKFEVRLDFWKKVMPNIKVIYSK